MQQKFSIALSCDNIQNIWFCKGVFDSIHTYNMYPYVFRVLYRPCMISGETFWFLNFEFFEDDAASSSWKAFVVDPHEEHVS